MASASPPVESFIDPDDPVFLAPSDMPGTIRDFCPKIGQPVPDNHGAVVRIAVESLALNYRWILETVEQLTGHGIRRRQIAGGGALDDLHCQLTANATGRPVLAGPVEATCMGNVMTQAMALRTVLGLPEIRDVIADSVRMKQLDPGPSFSPEAFARFRELKAPQAD